MLKETNEDKINRIFSKTKSSQDVTKSQKTSTNEMENSPRKAVMRKTGNSHLSSLGVPSNLLKTNLKKFKSESLQTLTQKKIKKTIPMIKYNLDDLQNKIKEINTQIYYENNISINQYNSLNDEIRTKITIIKELATEQKELISQLKALKNELNSKIEKANVIILKKNKDDKKGELLSKLITIKEKEIELADKNNNLIQKEYKRILRIFNNNNFSKELKLRKELFELKNEIIILEQEIRQLETILDKHKYCEKHKNELLKYLSLLTKAYEFEVKKNSINSLSDRSLTSEKENETYNLKLETINTNKKTSKTIHIRSPATPRIININTKLQKKLKNNKKSHLNLLSKNSFNYINKVINSINEESRKESGYINNSNNINYKARKNSLFKSNENIFLEKIIPNDFLIKCKERFDSIELENNKLKEKINLNKIKHERLINENQIKIELQEIKLKVNKKDEQKLNIEIYKTNKTIYELKKKINEINKETKKYNDMINIKNKENKNIKHKMQEMKKHLKRKKTKEIKEENINNQKENKVKISKSKFLKEEKQQNEINYHPK